MAEPEIWLLDHAPILGGAERFALRLARHAATASGAPQVRLVCPEQSPLADAARALGFPVTAHRFPDLSPRAGPAVVRAVLATRALLRRAGAAAVVANTSRAQAYVSVAVLALRRRPAIVQLVHEQETAARPTARLMFRRVGAVVAIGSNVAHAYREAVGAVPISQINNVIGPDELSDVVRRPAPGPPRLGVVARMIPEKGILELIGELFAGPAHWSTVQIAAPAQDPSYETSVRQRVEELGLADRVELVGEITRLSDFFGEVDAVLVPSIGGEGQPGVILEALAHGLPVVVRQPVWSPDYTGLPVRSYRDAGDLPGAISHVLAAPPAPHHELTARFGPEQAIAGILAAAKAARRDGRISG
ncbi:MAG: glycosyltransferase family 4 protein [Actinobacteria bacterium]|nr:MAG: glycosyltransferase family 4 protein [Actinomycetota bacterium]